MAEKKTPTMQERTNLQPFSPSFPEVLLPEYLPLLVPGGAAALLGIRTV